MRKNLKKLKPKNSKVKLESIKEIIINYKMGDLAKCLK